MKARRLGVGAAFFAATTFWNSAVYSQAKDEKKPEPSKPVLVKPPVKEKPSPGIFPLADPPPEGDEMAKMMEVWKKAATPGEFHTKLNPLAGKWTYTTKARMKQEMPWDESTGKAEYKWGLGKRVLYHEVKNNPSDMDAMMGGTFEGFGMTGYDNTSKKYYNVWADSMGTGVMMSTGSVDASGKIFTYSGAYDDPITGQKKFAKSVLKIDGEDKVVFEMYDKDAGGKEFMTLEVTYARQK